MEKKNKIFIATSIDGKIADKEGGIDWLYSIPNPEGIDMGYGEFYSNIDAFVIGRKTYETVCGFDIDWPYQKPVFVLSNSMDSMPEKHRGKAELVNGSLKEILEIIHKKKCFSLWIDGGKTIQSFLKEDLLDEMTITIIPFLLGGGIQLFADLPTRLEFECVKSKIYMGKIVQNHFVRVK